MVINIKKDFIFGMNMHPTGFSSYEKNNFIRDLRLIKETNSDYVRINITPHTDYEMKYLEETINDIHKNGLKIMLVIGGYDFYKIKSEYVEDYYYNLFAKTCKHLKGKIEIYQVFNELDVIAMHNDMGTVMRGGDGQIKEHYDIDRYNNAIKATKGAIKAIKDFDFNAKICINFAWWHTSLICEYYSNNIDFDYIGIDWYSDAEYASSVNELIDVLSAKISGKKFIICETNAWMHKHISNEEFIFDREKRNSFQAEWLPEFLKSAYDNPKIVGFFAYELLDEPCFEKDAYHGEAHFGLVECNKYGMEIVKKPVFYTYSNMIKSLKESL